LLFPPLPWGLPCDPVAAGQTIWIRLKTPVSTYTAKPGDPVRAVLTEDLECDGEVVFPIGTKVDGVVRSVRKVGYGIRHETAALELDFNRILPAGAEPVEVSALMLEVENAREQVTKGTIEGIR